MIALETSVKGVKSLKKYREPKNADSDIRESKDGKDEIESADTSNSEDDARSKNSPSEDEKTDAIGNPGWADVMRKILNTNRPKRKKTLILSKAKKLTDVKTKEIDESAPFEIEAEDETIKQETPSKGTKNEKNDEETAPTKRRRRDAQLGIRVKPSINDRQRERALQKIATKGVVQLFNVVKQQQMEIDRKIVEVGPLERKREQVLKSIDKRAFLDVLMGGSKSIPVDETIKSTKIENNDDNKADKVWNVLRDDFVMGAKLKDWDKKAPADEDDSTSSEQMDSD